MFRCHKTQLDFSESDVYLYQSLMTFYVKRKIRNIEMLNEIFFMVEEAPEGGYTARALGHSLFTEADTWDGLKEAIQDAVRCHFEEEKRPTLVRLHIVREEVLVA
jgi:hypothetical protein